jgi:hypothetical protein
MEKIFDAVYAPDSRPRQIMEASQAKNTSEPWDEDEDHRRFRQNLSESFDSFERGVEFLTAQKKKEMNLGGEGRPL